MTRIFFLAFDIYINCGDFRVFIIYKIANMTEPQSIKNEPFADFPRQSYSIIGDDFCHDKLLTIKPSVKTTKSVLKLKEVVSSKNGKLSFADETKLYFNLPKSASIYAKIKSGDYIKVHYDDGLRTISGKDVYLYSALNFNRSLDLLALKVGAGHNSANLHVDNRLKLSIEKGAQRYFWYNRTLVTNGNFKFGFVSCVDLCNKVIQKNNVLLGYNVDANTQAFLRAEVNGFREHNPNFKQVETVFDKVTLDLVRKFTNTTNRVTTVGLEVQIH